MAGFRGKVDGNWFSLVFQVVVSNISLIFSSIPGSRAYFSDGW